MSTENINTKIEFTNARKCSNEMLDIIQKMRNKLEQLNNEVENMKWSGSNAAEFKSRIKVITLEFERVSKEYITKIPENIEMAISNYQNNEE